MIKYVYFELKYLFKQRGEDKSIRQKLKYTYV